jgi:D-glycero-beta-D-manno-heptose-7-phosphate kinase
MMFPARATLDLVARLRGRRIVVVGDLIADEYLYGKPARISREAPVLILRFTDREVRLGGGANAAHNVQALGAHAVPVGVVGDDEAGAEVTALFERAGIGTEGLVRAAGRRTPVKTRIMAGGYESTRQQVVRLDREPEPYLLPEVEEHVLERLAALAREADGFVLSDYGYGVLSPRVFDVVRELARERDAPVSVDSRYDLLRFRGATAATPNEPEVEALTGGELGDERSIEKAGRQVLERLEARLLLVTRGSRGMALFERDGPVTFIPIHGSDQIADVTGAGDTVISAFTTALAAGASPGHAAWLANVAGGVVVMKRGTASATAADLAQALASEPGSDGAHPRA